MAGFKYFLPRVTSVLTAAGGIDHSVLATHGLERTLGDCRDKADIDVHDVPGPGPSGTPGLLLTPRRAGGGDDQVSRTYKPDRQQWLSSADGTVWIGWEREALPTPADLARHTIVGGYELPDSSGRLWTIPVARSSRLEFGRLPQTYRFDAEGQAYGRIKPEFEELWQRAGQLWELYSWSFSVQHNERTPEAPVALREPPEAHISNRWLLMQAVWILGVNYRVGPLEVNAFAEAGVDLLDDDFKTAVCQAVCDFDFLEEVAKKVMASTSFARASAGLSSTPGDVGA